MITLNQFLEMIDYKIDYGMPIMINEPKPYGENPHEMECHTPSDVKSGSNEHIATVTFDTKTREVYEAIVSDNDRGIFYRLLNPMYKEDILTWEEQNNDGDDEYKEILLETDEDFLTKGRAIFLNKDYDENVAIPLDIDDETLLKLFTRAHELDMKFNDFVIDILEKRIAQIKSEEENKNE